MIRLILMMVTAVFLVEHASAETAYVTVEVANERSGPGKHYAIQNRVFIGQKVTIYDRQDSWARVTDFKYSPRWIHAPLLSANKPIVGSGFVLPVELRRSDLSALASKPVSNLNGHDVIALRRFAAHALDTGKCSKIEDGDESLNRPGQLYIWCENYRKLYSPKSQWIPD